MSVNGSFLWSTFSNIKTTELTSRTTTRSRSAPESASRIAFAEKAGINASAFLYYVIENKRNLTKNSIFKISRAIGHGKREAEYFENLVFFNQARTIAEKTNFYNRLIDTRKHIDIKRVGKNQMEYYSAWYHSVIREVAPLVDFRDDYVRLARCLEPAITPQQAKQSVQLLERDENGLYHQTDILIGATVSGADAFPIEQFQREMLSLALKSYEFASRDQRLSASTTFSVSEETFKLFLLKTREFRKELLELARLDGEWFRARPSG
ncbi:MAG: TIGR02147 family protein [Chitinivibrionales bacterium]|nr:TIGR02147 family protein [Chitinivibrionales bacterium]